MGIRDGYFDEGDMPFREPGDQRVPIARPMPPHPHDDTALPGAPSVTVTPTAVTPYSTTHGVIAKRPIPAADSPEALYSAALRRTPLPALSSRKFLILYSGPYARPDGLASTLIGLGYEVLLVDNDPRDGDTNDDIMDTDFFDALLAKARRGEFLAIFAAPPCSTFSVGRSFRAAGSDATGAADGGPPAVRSRSHPDGLPNPPPGHERELADSNILILRTLALLNAAILVGSQFVIENPADHGDVNLPGFIPGSDHAPLWLLPAVLEFETRAGDSKVTFAQCQYGAPYQKYTTLMYSPGLSTQLGPLANLLCTHTSHGQLAGGLKSTDGWNSKATAAYPPDLCLMLARSLASLGSVTPPADPNPLRAVRAPLALTNELAKQIFWCRRFLFLSVRSGWPVVPIPRFCV